MVLKYADYLGLTCQFISETYIIIWSKIKKEEKLILSLVKYNTYTTEVKFTYLIRELVGEVRKLKLIL